MAELVAPGRHDASPTRTGIGLGWNWGFLGRGIDNLLRDLSVGLDNHLLHVLRSLDGLGLVVHPLKLLERTALGLDAVRSR